MRGGLKHSSVVVSSRHLCFDFLSSSYSLVADVALIADCTVMWFRREYGAKVATFNNEVTGAKVFVFVISALFSCAELLASSVIEPRS